MEIYFAKSNPETVDNITFSLNGRKLEISANGYNRSIEVKNGDAFYCAKGAMPKKWSEGLTRGQVIMQAYGIPMEIWAESYANFENRRKAIIDSHTVKMSDTYVRDDFTYMTRRTNSKEELLLVWVADTVASSKQLSAINLALKELGNDRTPGVLILV